jgi:DNA/RNA endonuclease G (NUC1)
LLKNLKNYLTNKEIYGILMSRDKGNPISTPLVVTPRTNTKRRRQHGKTATIKQLQRRKHHGKHQQQHR